MKAFKTFFVGLLLLISFVVQAGDKYPTGPNLTSTPGTLCEDSPVHRYPEDIVYCERAVDTSLKKEIIQMYDEQFGYQIRQMPRGDFKIDHFIPLSIGGSNSRQNLWPQHKSVYNVTDPLEHLLFERIKEGRIKQQEAIRVIREGKLNLDRVPELIDYVEKM